MFVFWLDKTMLPVAPPKLQTKINGKNKTLTLINEGEINLLKAPGLTDISFTALLPNLKYPFASYPDGFKQALVYAEELERLKTRTDANGNYLPFQFKVLWALSGGFTPFTLDMTVSLEDYKINNDVNNGYDLSVDINLKEYKKYGTKLVNVNLTDGTATVEQQRTVENPPTKPNYTVSGGDSLWSVAQKMLGDGSRYPELYELNKEAINERNKGTGNTQYTIYTGQTLVIPQEGAVK